jgi:hypothetical protein
LDCDTAAIIRTSRTDTYVVVDEDGKLKGLPPNPRASWRFYPAPIVGDVLLMKLTMENPNTEDADWRIDDIGDLMVRHTTDWDN